MSIVLDMNHNQGTHSLKVRKHKVRRWRIVSISLDTQPQQAYSPPINGQNRARRLEMMSIILDTQSQPGYSQPTNEQKQDKEMGNDEYCSGHPITTRLLTAYR